MATTRHNKPNSRDNRSIANNVKNDLEHSLYLRKQKRLNNSISYEDNRSTCKRAGCKNKLGYHSKRNICSQCTDIEKFKTVKHNLLKKNTHTELESCSKESCLDSICSKNAKKKENHTELESCSKDKTKESYTELESCSKESCLDSKFSKHSKTKESYTILESCPKGKTKKRYTELESCSKESCLESKFSKN